MAAIKILILQFEKEKRKLSLCRRFHYSTFSTIFAPTIFETVNNQYLWQIKEKLHR